VGYPGAYLKKKANIHSFFNTKHGLCCILQSSLFFWRLFMKRVVFLVFCALILVGGSLFASPMAETEIDTYVKTSVPALAPVVTPAPAPSPVVTPAPVLVGPAAPAPVATPAPATATAGTGSSPVWNAVNAMSEWVLRVAYDLPYQLPLYSGDTLSNELPAYPIPQQNIPEVTAFSSSFIVGSLSGAAVLELANYITAVAPQVGSVGTVQGVTITNITGGKITALALNGETLEKDRIYIYVTNDYLFTDPDGFTILLKSKQDINTSAMLAWIYDEVITYLGELVEPYTDSIHYVTP
jgi:hypothetical protein